MSLHPLFLVFRMLFLPLIHVVLRDGTLLRVMSIILLLAQLCLRVKYLLFFWEVIFLLLEVMLLLPEHIFLLTECLMGHLMGFHMDLTMDHNMDRFILLIGTGIKNLLTL